MSTKGPHDDDSSDRTVVRPRGAPSGGGLPGGYPPPPAPPPAHAGAAPPPPPRRPSAWQPAAPSGAAAPPAQISDFLGGSANPLVQAASPLLLLAVQLRGTASQPNAMGLREQVVNQVRQFESRAQAAGLTPQMTTAARYALCAMLDEAVLNTPWAEHSGWAAKTLLTIFHSETYGGEKFFLILDRLTQDFAKHLDLIEMMYLCIALGFGGRYQIEPAGQARLADIQEELYRRIKSQRQPPADELAPHWKGIEDRRNPLLRYVPLWVIAAAGACVLLGVFLYFYAQLNAASAPLSARLSQIGLESAVPADAPKPVVARKSLKQLLAPQEQAGYLTVDESPDGKALIRLISAEMFPSGGVQVGANGDDGAGLSTFEDGHDAVPGDVRSNLVESECTQPLGDDARGALLTVRELRVHVEVAALRDESRAHRLGRLRDRSLTRGHLRRGALLSGERRGRGKADCCDKRRYGSCVHSYPPGLGEKWAGA